MARSSLILCRSAAILRSSSRIASASRSASFFVHEDAVRRSTNLAGRRAATARERRIAQLVVSRSHAPESGTVGDVDPRGRKSWAGAACPAGRPEARRAVRAWGFLARVSSSVARHHGAACRGARRKPAPALRRRALWRDPPAVFVKALGEETLHDPVPSRLWKGDDDETAPPSFRIRSAAAKRSAGRELARARRSPRCAAPGRLRVAGGEIPSFARRAPTPLAQRPRARPWCGFGARLGDGAGEEVPRAAPPRQKVRRRVGKVRRKLGPVHDVGRRRPVARHPHVRAARRSGREKPRCASSSWKGRDADVEERRRRRGPRCPRLSGMPVEGRRSGPPLHGKSRASSAPASSPRDETACGSRSMAITDAPAARDGRRENSRPAPPEGSPSTMVSPARGARRSITSRASITGA